MRKTYLTILLACSAVLHVFAQSGRTTRSFDANWSFRLGDGAWRTVQLPHDWSIEGEFSKDNPATPDGGALPGGVGYYQKSFTVPRTDSGKLIYIDFDGVYEKSEVTINGHLLGFRPNGYISFRYELTPYLRYGGQPNLLEVKVDNGAQPNSRYYSGSGIFRNVWLVTTNKIAVDHWGTFVTTPTVNRVFVQTIVKNATPHTVVTHKIVDAGGKTVAGRQSDGQLDVPQPHLWSIEDPYLYKMVTEVSENGRVQDSYTTPFGIRTFRFDADKGFFLNGKPLKILGVCNHHDLGALGAAINTRAIQRQLEILKAMGCNAIRTSHNPPAPELLDLCDQMGFIVMDEAFDMWEKPKRPYDYHLFFKEWHSRDLQDQVLRDRNHPSVFIWSIGNEIPEQTDSSGYRIAKELAAVLRALDTTRPITSANNRPSTNNQIVGAGAVDLIGYNYHNKEVPGFPDRFPGMKFIGTETTSAFETRGEYDMPSDSIRRWNNKKPGLNANYTASSYDNASATWGNTHEEAWKVIKKYPFASGMFIWTGFDYLGEPTPYSWPARSSYFGIIDLAGIPKDIYYMYQSEWTDKPVLHLLPHWNWQAGQTVDVWAFYNNADEVELFLNGQSLGVRSKKDDDLHVQWRVAYAPGTLKAVSRLKGKEVLTTEVRTAGAPARIELQADRSVIKADGKDLSYVTVKILDKDGYLVPHADNLVTFEVKGEGVIAAVDNGDPISHQPFKANYRKVFNGYAMVILQSVVKTGSIQLTASAPNLQAASVTVAVH